jgi:hypothetical protein
MALRHLLGSVLLALSLSAPAQTCEANGRAVLHAAEEYEGVVEKTGRNDGSAIEHMLRMVGLGKGHPWCGAYVFTAYAEAGLVVEGGARAYAWAPTWHPPHRRVWSARSGNNAAFKGNGPKHPIPGDVIGLYYPHLKRIGHVGVWDRDEGKYVVTWEGNTNGAGSREGDGVYRKRRLKAQIHCASRWVC